MVATMVATMVGKGLLPKTPDVEVPLVFNGLRCDNDKSLVVETETENKRVPVYL
jgi:hypothetical protein